MPPVAAGGLLWAADDEALAAGADVAAVGADEVPCADDAAALLDVGALAGVFDDEHATRLATTATDSAVVLPSRRPIVDVFTGFLPRLGVCWSRSADAQSGAGHGARQASCGMMTAIRPNRFANRFDRIVKATTSVVNGGSTPKR